MTLLCLRGIILFCINRFFLSALLPCPQNIIAELFAEERAVGNCFALGDFCLVEQQARNIFHRLFLALVKHTVRQFDNQRMIRIDFQNARTGKSGLLLMIAH